MVRPRAAHDAPPLIALSRPHGVHQRRGSASAARLGTDAGGSNPYYGIERTFPDSGIVRFSETVNHDASVTRLLAPASDYPNEGRHVDTPVLYHLLQTTNGVDGAETDTVDRSTLGRQDVTYYRSSSSATYDVTRSVRHAPRHPPRRSR